MKEIFDLTEPPLYKKERSRKIPSYWLGVLFLYLLLLGYFAMLIDDILPSPVSNEQAGNTSFSEERARKKLETIVGSGPRVAGTVYHYNQTVVLKGLIDSIAESAIQPVRTDWQVVSGDFFLSRKNYFVNVYENVSNVIAIIEGASGFNADGTTNTSILFNCHYDSVPVSPGASDNALFCAVMVEVFEILSKRAEPFRHNIIFLFNGAEENPLQGAPGFLKHDWSKGVTAVVNLDSAGINSKSTVFQVTDPRVVNAYKRSVSLPSAQAFGEVLFKLGLVPSDTDFRIFRDFGNIYGVDIAFAKGGYVYHTRNDAIDLIADGVIQHSGDFILALAKELSGSEEFYYKTEPETMVYYDYLNLFMLSYSTSMADVVDWIIVVIATCSLAYYLTIVGFRKSMFRELSYAILGRLLCMAAGFSCLIVLTVIMVSTTIQMRYLYHNWLVVPLYWVPYLVGAVATSQLFDLWRCSKTGLNRVRRVAQSMAATRLLLIVVTIVLLSIKGTATMRYIITFPLLLSSVMAFISLTVLSRYRIDGIYQTLLDVILSTPAMLFYLVIAVKFNGLMLPIMGRSASSTPDYLVAGLNGLCCVLAVLPLCGIEISFSRMKLWMPLSVFALASIVMCFIPFSPYHNSGHRPTVQRHYWFNYETRDFDINGQQLDHQTQVWFSQIEANAAKDVKSQLNSINLTYSEDFSDCGSYVYCNLPTFYPRHQEMIKGSFRAYFDPPTPTDVSPSLVANKTCTNNVCNLDLEATSGTSHLSLIVWPRDNVTINSWSLNSEVNSATEQNGRLVYYIYYSCATNFGSFQPYHVSLEFNVTSEANPIADISLIAHRIYHPEQFTTAYTNLVNSMPSYYNIATFLSSRYNYVF